MAATSNVFCEMPYQVQIQIIREFTSLAEMLQYTSQVEKKLSQEEDKLNTSYQIQRHKISCRGKNPHVN